MYEVVIECSVYETWRCYDTWLGVPSDAGGFDDWVVEHYPEVILAECVYGTGFSPGYSATRRFTFASEELYQWFLLKM